MLTRYKHEPLTQLLQYLKCPGSLPTGSYPESINMKPARTDEHGHVRTLEYTDSWGETEYIFEMEGLCYRAGCVCSEGRVVCVNFDEVFFEFALYNAFSTTCVDRCSCTTLNERIIFDHDPRYSSGTEDLIFGNIHVIHEVGRPPNAVTKNNPTGSAFGGVGCLKGQAAGWTLWNWRLTKCCAGTTFEALDAPEAYAIYGVAPYSDATITSHVTIGVCLWISRGNPGQALERPHLT
ncbi:MAG: hypothetical protein L6R39_007014 [Caloplaca ligustica]|nr:MAG: hypothetical protein L6R39_007014 [Caloplaca ligustica]